MMERQVGRVSAEQGCWSANFQLAWKQGKSTSVSARAALLRGSALDAKACMGVKLKVG